MKIDVWENGQQREMPHNDLKECFSRPTWISFTDPTKEELEKAAQALDIPNHILVGRLHSNYTHIDNYPEYTKIFSWYLSKNPDEKEITFRKKPIVILTNKVSTITISSSKTGTYEKISKELKERNNSNLSTPPQIIYLTITHLLGSYEKLLAELEELVEGFEEAIPPWPRNFYQKAFRIRKNANRFLRLLKHFRTTIELLTKERTYIILTEEEKRIFDLAYDRAVGAEETAEMSLEAIKRPCRHTPRHRLPRHEQSYAVLGRINKYRGDSITYRCVPRYESRRHPLVNRVLAGSRSQYAHSSLDDRVLLQERMAKKCLD